MAIMRQDVYGIELIDKAIVADFMHRPLPLMRYKDFTWPNNPATCTYSCDRSIIKHKYPELDAVELEDMDSEGVVITGTGEFFGYNAYNYWTELVNVFRSHGIGELYHPIFKDVVMASFKKLNCTLEPRPHYVQYTFEFWEHRPPVAIQPSRLSVSVGGSGSTASLQSRLIRRGDRGSMVVKIQKVLVSDNKMALPKYGVDGIFGPETENAVRMYQSKHKLKVDGIVGPQTLSHMGLVYTDDVQSGTDIVYIVKSGDTLWAIAKRYNSDWKTIAKYNNMKNPHLIYPGDKVRIPR